LENRLKYSVLKTGAGLIVFLLLQAVLPGCTNPPVYPDAPVISFQSLTFERNYVTYKTGAGQTNDTADFFFLTCNYQDGNGDLGLDQGDTTGPFIRYLGTNPNGTFKLNPNYYNFFPVLYEALKDSANFKLYILPVANFNFYSRFGRISSDDVQEPVKGTITYRIRITRKLLPKGRRYKFKLYIQDRALNASNTIETAEVTAN
jgi:hypothetical protein